jgi:hypothetical protein
MTVKSFSLECNNYMYIVTLIILSGVVLEIVHVD